MRDSAVGISAGAEGDDMRASLWNTAARGVQSRTLAQWLAEYGESHKNPTNKLLHWICVPPDCAGADGDALGGAFS
jgi:hypothetical protein